VVYGSCQPTACSLWRAWVAGDREPERIELAGLRASSPATVGSKDVLAFTRDFSDVDIYRFRAGRPAEAVLSSSFFDYGPDFSPDGNRIAFSSGRTGAGQEIWLADADGSNPAQLTHGPGQHQGGPRWSSDGRQIAFNSQAEDGHWDVWAIDADGGNARRLTHGPGDSQLPSWSRDGRWIYFSSNRDRAAGTDVWRMPAKGGPAERVTRTGGDLSHEAVDGGTLFFKSDALDSPLVGLPLTGGSERRIADCVPHWGFDVARQGVYHLECAPGQPETSLRLFDPLTGQDRLLGKLETGHGLFLGMAVSPDGRTVLFTKWVAEGADLMMIENFR
jgi:dipeptidyl aminopeptidase/acylaminoacyl peptidase